MSIEKALADLTAAVEANTDALTNLMASASKSASSAGAKAAKTEDTEDAPKRRGRPAAADKKAAPKKPANITNKKMEEEAETFLDVEDDDEYETRSKQFKAIVDYFNADKFTQIDKSDRELALKLLKSAAAGELDAEDVQATVDELDGEGGDNEEDEAPKRRRRNTNV
jgi:uncharacterized protein with von Willebrand factor type A (vWA) domain